MGIIAMLAALLLPSLTNAREQARRAACASNLRQWGVALLLYYGDNGAKLPATCSLGGSGRFPSTCLVSNNPNGEISIEGMSKYLPGVDFASKSIGQI